MKTIIKSAGLYLTDAEETELMEGPYIPEVGDIIQVTDTDYISKYWKYGDIGRVVELDENKSFLHIDFSLSLHPANIESCDGAWEITLSSVTKIRYSAGGTGTKGGTMKIYCADLEADDLLDGVTKIHCLGIQELVNGKATRDFVLTDYDDIEAIIREPDVYWVFHNGVGYDVPVVHKIINNGFKGTVIDSYGLSMYLEPNRRTHNLADYGEEFGVPKPVVEDWENQDIEVYIDRVTEDVKIQTKLWKKQWSKLLSLYGDETLAMNAARYIGQKMYALHIAERSKCMLDVEETKRLHTLFSERFEEAKTALQENMPDVPVYTIRKPPKKPFKKDGSLSATGLRWTELTASKGHSFEYRKDIPVQTGTVPPNAGSHQQIKDYLHGLGWNPASFDFKRDKETGEVRKIPQVRDSDTGELCSSVEKLVSKDPAIRYLSDMGVLSHRKSVVAGFLRNVDREGFIVAGSHGFTNTLRLRHRALVNLPSSRKPYGEEIRGLLIPRSRRNEFLGADLCSLEDRIKQHYLYKFDPEYVKELQVDGYDPHLAICLQAGMMTQEEVDEYNNPDTSEERHAELGLIRHGGKGTNYSCQYGAGAPAIALGTGISLSKAKVLHNAYWTKNWAIKAVADECVVRKVRGLNWLYNPVSQMWYYLKADKDRFSTLVQGTASYVFDLWVDYILLHRPQITAQFHDEVLLEVRKGYRNQIEKVVMDGIRHVNDTLTLNVDLSCDLEFGDNYYKVH